MDVMQLSMSCPPLLFEVDCHGFLCGLTLPAFKGFYNGLCPLVEVQSVYCLSGINDNDRPFRIHQVNVRVCLQENCDWHWLWLGVYVGDFK